MTRDQYRWVVAGQIALICVLGLIAVGVFLGALPQFRSRQNLADAIEHYERGTEAALREAHKALDRALARDPEMAPALALRGRIATEQGEAAIALDAYNKLRETLRKKRQPEAPALNGIGCATLLEALGAKANVRRRTEEAQAKFLSAIEGDPTNGDPHVNAAICSLHMGNLTDAAAHLAEARRTRSLSREALVGYYAGVGSMFSAAASKGRKVAAEVAAKFKDPDIRLRKTGHMLLRGIQELDKATLLAQGPTASDRLRSHVALANARLLALAPLKREQAYKCWRAIEPAVSKHRSLLDLRQRQQLCLILAASHQKFTGFNSALTWARRAVQQGALSPDMQFLVGATLFQLAQSRDSSAHRAQLKKEATEHLLKALASPELPQRARFRALADLAVGLWYAKDSPGALKHMTEAAELLATLEGRPGGPSKTERSCFYRNLGLMLYQAEGSARAEELLRRSLEIDPSQKDLQALLPKMTQGPVIEDIKTILPQGHVPSMPIVTAVVSGGAARLRKDDIRVEISGEPVAFTCGPNSRIYALPRRPLLEGTHTITITVSRAGKRVRHEGKFEVEYFKGRLKQRPTQKRTKGG